MKRTRVDDEGLAQFTSLKKLQSLDLSECPAISDRGLDSLAKIGSLTELQLDGNPRLTEPAIERLRAALPGCRVTSDARPALSPAQP